MISLLASNLIRGDETTHKRKKDISILLIFFISQTERKKKTPGTRVATLINLINNLFSILVGHNFGQDRHNL